MQPEYQNATRATKSNNPIANITLDFNQAV
jgi:hypothetical protein